MLTSSLLPPPPVRRQHAAAATQRSARRRSQERSCGLCGCQRTAACRRPLGRSRWHATAACEAASARLRAAGAWDAVAGMQLLLVVRKAATCAASIAHGCLRVRPSLDAAAFFARPTGRRQHRRHY
ncbi:hypothetical protein GW17_00062246 [Ensete ventricosum]|nr:hypothetical protein GW17_00062246 [Ensete ventricosum]